MAKQIETRRVFAPLADESIFTLVHVADEGRAIRWTDDIDYCADALWLEAEETGRTPSTEAAE